MSLPLVSLLGAGPHRQPVCQGYGAATVVAFAHSAGKEQEIYHLGAVDWATEERPMKGDTKNLLQSFKMKLFEGAFSIRRLFESSVKLVREGEGRTTELMDGVKPDIDWMNTMRSYDHRPGNNKEDYKLPSKDESLALLSCLVGYEDAMECKVTVNGLIGGGISLSGLTRGERKLLALATALLANPSILFIEEPTHELGTSSAEKIGANLLAFETGLTVTATLHHPSTHFDGLFDMLHLRRGSIGLVYLTLGLLRHATLALVVYAVLLMLFVTFRGFLTNVTGLLARVAALLAPHFPSQLRTSGGCIALKGEGLLKHYNKENRSALGDTLILFTVSFTLFFFASGFS
ncbi:P-loop containing nucleoside triphosphate hydrolase [Phytophthora cactorum]|nr:P-loop containing nucleoside triphosphate hydrolase [Phytophthora cactorum]